MTSKKQKHLQETHPELVFWRLNERQPLPSKKTDQGRSLRIALLKKRGIARIEEWLAQRYGTGVGRDDLIDACACAIVARDRDTKNRLRAGEPITKQGIKTEIWY
jgi:predicted RNase H-like nuclease